MKIGRTYQYRRPLDGKKLQYDVLSFDAKHCMYTVRFEGNKRSTVMGQNSKMHLESIEVPA